MGKPFTDQRRFPEAGRGRDERKSGRALETCIQPLDQTGTNHYFERRWGNVEFRGQDWRGGDHEAIIVRIVGLPPIRENQAVMLPY